MALAAAALAGRPPQECRGPSTASQAAGEPNKRPLCSSLRLQDRPVGMGEPAAEWSLRPGEHEEDMEAAGGSRRGHPPPAHIPPPGAAARTPQGRPGECGGRLLLSLCPWDRLGMGLVPCVSRGWDHDDASVRHLCGLTGDVVGSSPVGGGVLSGQGAVASSAPARGCCFPDSCQDSAVCPGHRRRRGDWA